MYTAHAQCRRGSARGLIVSLGGQEGLTGGRVIAGDVMARKQNEPCELAAVSALLAERKLDAVRFTKEEMRSGQTPDFKVLRDGELVAFCEVKSTHDYWLDDQLDAAPPGEVVGGSRDDPTFNRLSNAIHKAVGQFDSVNPSLDHLNLLVIVNYDDMSGPDDLRETLTGEFWSSDGSRHATTKHISEGRIKDEKHRIDLYAMLNAKSGKLEGCIINESDLSRAERVCVLMKLNRERIYR